MPYDVFISYSRRDNEQGRVTQLVDRIKQDFAPFAKRELVPFFDVDEIHGMQDWRLRILQGLRESRLLLACLSPEYLKSDYCEWEFVEYLKYEIGHLHGFNGVALIYFVVVPGWDEKDFDKRCAGWVAELRRRQNFDLRPWYEQGEEALREAVVRERLEKLNRQIAETILRGERAEKSLGNVDAPNLHFIGRTPNLRMLRENFIKPGNIGVLTAVNGLGGLGKTALAIQYAYSFADDYGGGRWQVRCADKDDLRLALAELATPIGFEFTEDEKKSADFQFERIRRELKKLADARKPHRCLLILDNVDQPDLLDPAQVARLNSGDWLHVLATTRLGENELHGSHLDRSFLAVDELPPNDALALIESYQHGGHFPSDAERDAARAIVQLLGCFTLAVESAAVYLGQFGNDITCAAFLVRMKKEGLEGLDAAASQSSEGVLHGEKRLNATLQPTLERLGAAEKLALDFAALLPPDQVPLPWLRALVAKTFPEMDRDAEPGYPDPWKNVLRCLFSLRLFQATDVRETDNQPRVARVHRLVQELIKRKPDEGVKQRHDALVAHAFERSEELEKHWHEPDYQWEIVPLVLFATRLLDDTDHAAPQLVKYLGQWLSYIDSPPRVEQLYRVALQQLRADSATEPTEVAIAANNLASPLMRQGRFAEALVLLEEALTLDEKYRDPDHPFIAIRLANLGFLLREARRMQEAEPYMRRSVELSEHILKPDDPVLGLRLNNLSQVLIATERFAEAEELLKRAEAIWENTGRLMHPNAAITISGLAQIKEAAKCFVQAESLHRRALEIVERCLGPNHPTVARALNSLASCLVSQRRLVDAEPMMRRALAILEKSPEADHPNVAIVLNNLAQLLTTTNRFTEAEPLMRRALTIREKALGPDHPDTFQSMEALAGLLEATGRFEEAAALRQRVMEAQERKLGPEHPDTLRGWSKYSVELLKHGHAEQAEAIVRKVAATTAKIFGDAHALSIHRRNKLVLTLVMLSKLEEAPQILATNWRLKAPPHANTTPRIALLRYVIALLESEPPTFYLGQLKTLLTGPELSMAPGVAFPWDIAYFVESLHSMLQPTSSEFVGALIAVLNDHNKLADLDRFPEWRNQAPIPLDTPWPSA